MNNASDLTLFWGIDGGVEMIKLLHQYGVDLSRRTPKDWTPLSYAKAKGKYGATEEKGIYPEVTHPSVLLTTASRYSRYPNPQRRYCPQPTYHPLSTAPPPFPLSRYPSRDEVRR